MNCRIFFEYTKQVVINFFRRLFGNNQTVYEYDIVGQDSDDFFIIDDVKEKVEEVEEKKEEIQIAVEVVVEGVKEEVKDILDKLKDNIFTSDTTSTSSSSSNEEDLYSTAMTGSELWKHYYDYSSY